MVENVIYALKDNSRFRKRMEHVEVLPARAAVYRETKEKLPPNIQSYLTKKAVKLYKHQADAIDSLRDGKNVIITTPTASGKTLAFTIPIFERLTADRQSRALFLYPTKALSNDQLKLIKEFDTALGAGSYPEIYDGDTPASRRPRIRELSRIIISNPHELHHVLPWHYKWQKFFGHLQFIVIDEAHRYRGILGSNIAFLVRRLLRICNFYGSNPQFILSTATVANPLEFAEKLVGRDFELIADDGSPRGRKHFIFYNPFFNGIGELSTHQETKDLFLFLVRNDLQSLCFTGSRKMAELVTMWSREDLEESDQDLMGKIAAYRAGYLPEERRKIEDGLKRGHLKGVVSTNALELGIDVGSLDSVVISGYPGTIISTWQQAGRAGRRIGDSLVALVAFQNPLDQYFMKHPSVFFDKPHEHAIVDLHNPYIVSGHLLCAASELPLRPEELEGFAESSSKGVQGAEPPAEVLGARPETIKGVQGSSPAGVLGVSPSNTVARGLGGVPQESPNPGVLGVSPRNYQDLLMTLEAQSLVQNTPNGWVYSGPGRPTEAVALDSISSDTFKVMCDGQLIETMERSQAFREAHKGAILLHQGQTYQVHHFDLNKGVVDVKKVDVDYYTQALKDVEVEILAEIKKNVAGGVAVSFGTVKVTEQYIGYKIMRYDKTIARERLVLPPLDFETMALWFTIPNDLRQAAWNGRKGDDDVQEALLRKPEEVVEREAFHGGLHAIEHAMIGVMPFHVMCDRWDIGGVSMPGRSATMEPTVFIYDGFEGGIGLTEKAYDLIEEIVKMAHELVRDCQCETGCPSCVFSPKCGNENRPLDKKAAELLLEQLQVALQKAHPPENP